MRKPTGFTLAELLISLAIIGEIATFTIPKVLSAQQNGRYKAVAKEAAATIAAAYNLYQMQTGVSAYTTPSDILTALNYIKLQTTGAIDGPYGTSGDYNCSTSSPCYVLANGAIIRDPFAKIGGNGTGNNFGGTATTNYIYFYMDPDGSNADSGTTNGPGKAIQFDLYYNGRITDVANCKSGDTTYLGATGYSNWCPGSSPPWFDWN